MMHRADCWKGLRRRARTRAFTLIELMIIVVIIGILSSMAVESYQHQIARSKTAEPRAALGAIRRGVSVAANQEWMASAVLAPGESSTDISAGESKVTGGGADGKGKGKGKGATVVHNGSTRLCASANSVPADFAQVKRSRYQSAPADWQQGGKYEGWPCLGFTMLGAQYYQYGYDVGGPKVQVTLPKGGSPPGLDRNFTYTAWARGDLDGDGRTSWFVTEGAMIDGDIRHSTGIGVVDETE